MDVNTITFSDGHSYMDIQAPNTHWHLGHSSGYLVNTPQNCQNPGRGRKEKATKQQIKADWELGTQVLSIKPWDKESV